MGEFLLADLQLPLERAIQTIVGALERPYGDDRWLAATIGDIPEILSTGH